MRRSASSLVAVLIFVFASLGASCASLPGTSSHLRSPPVTSRRDALPTRGPTPDEPTFEPARAPTGGSSAVGIMRREETTIAYVANGEEDAIVAVDIERESAVAVASVAGWPFQLLPLSHGRLAAVLRESGDVVLFSALRDGGLSEIGRAHVGSEPSRSLRRPTNRGSTSRWASMESSSSSTARSR
jgi:hypothetical protein